MTRTDQPDVITLLRDQHDRIRSMFADVDKAAGSEAKQESFTRLRRFLAVHETAEELIVHPRARMADQGQAVVDERLGEERQAKEVLSRLDGMRVTDPDFSPDFEALREAVLSHAEQEEREEFPLLEDSTDQKTRTLMAQAVTAAEALAPTHPHPGVESMAANLFVGPVASLVDRTRDAIRAVLGRET